MCQKNPGLGHKKLHCRRCVCLDALLEKLQKVAEIAYITSTDDFLVLAKNSIPVLRYYLNCDKEWGQQQKKVNCNMLPYHLSSHTENLCYKKCRHKDFTSESYRACTWRQLESAGHNSRGRLNMFFVQIFAVISLLAFQFGIVCTCNCFYC